MNRTARVARKAQRGVILFVALIVLVAMTLTGIALIRSVDTNLLVAGNLAFRQGATAAADWGVETARVFLRTALVANKSALDNNQLASAYYATWQASLDLHGTGVGAPFDWSGSSLLVGTDSAGNEVRYVLHRMCGFEGPGTSAIANCVKTAGSSGSSPADGGTKGTVSYGALPLPAPTVIYYRVTVRVLGPRNTLSFVQAMLK